MYVFCECSTLQKTFGSWLFMTKNREMLEAKAEQLKRMVCQRLARESETSYFRAWHAYVARMGRLRVVLSKILGRHMSRAFYGWR